MVKSRRYNCLQALVVATLLLLIAGNSDAQVTLGGQRVGTSSGSFLRIGIGARPVAMGGAFVAIADDITSCTWNPAGLINMTGTQIALNHISYIADISYDHACYGFPVKALDGAVAIQFGSLSTELIETQEYYPYGTGRTFTFSDWIVGVSLAKRFTDRFSGGFAIKYVREELGVEVGGPVTNAIVLDAGTYYEIGPRNMRLGVALMNFGADWTPSGTYKKRTDHSVAESYYEGFAPATEFKFGLAFEPVRRPGIFSILDIELCHPADNAETIRLGGEVVFSDALALRSGYDLNADEMKLSVGAGATVRMFARKAHLDYAATFTDYLGTIHRLSLRLEL